jgi:hypothetical protein
MFFPVEGIKTHSLLKTATDGSVRTTRRVSLKNVAKAAVWVLIDQGAATPVVLEVQQATGISGSPALKALSAVVPIFANEAVNTDDTMVRQADAKTYTSGATTVEKLVCFIINPVQCLDVANQYDTIALITTGASSSNNVTVWIEAEMKNQQATPPTIVAD